MKDNSEYKAEIKKLAKESWTGSAGNFAFFWAGVQWYSKLLEQRKKVREDVDKTAYVAKFSSKLAVSFFKSSNRYCVIKVKQLNNKAVPLETRLDFEAALKRVEFFLKEAGIEPVSGLFIENTWPEFEPLAEALHKRIVAEATNQERVNNHE